jgi:hypothetical protein
MLRAVQIQYDLSHARTRTRIYIVLAVVAEREVLKNK